MQERQRYFSLEIARLTAFCLIFAFLGGAFSERVIFVEQPTDTTGSLPEVYLDQLYKALRVQVALSSQFHFREKASLRLHTALIPSEKKDGRPLWEVEAKVMFNGHVIARTRVKKELAAKKPTESLIQGTIQEMAKETVRQLEKLFRIKGSVVEVVKNYATVHIFSAETLPRESEVVFFRGTRVVGEGTVVESSPSQVRVQVDSGDVQLDDRIQAKAFASFGKQARTGKKKSFWKKALITLGGLGIAYLIFKDRGGKKTSAQETTASSKAKSIQLTANPTSVPADGFSSATLTALVKDENNVAVEDGTPVLFATTAGTVVISGGATTATTTNGVATAKLVAPTSAGTATVTVTSGEAKSTTTVTFTATTSPPASITLAAEDNPISIESSGANIGRASTTITASVTDAEGSPVPDGTTVTFKTDLGSITGQASTSKGIASVTFTSTVTGTATITATSGTVSQTLAITIQPGAPAAVSVEADPQVIEADGHTFSTIKATVTDISGNLVTDGTQVNFSVIPDDQGGGNGDITPAGFTVNGVAQAILISRVPDTSDTPANSGTATIVATVPSAQPEGIPAPSADFKNSKTKVTFVSKVASVINFAASDTNLRGLDILNAQTTITALVFDSNGNPVPDGTAVFFSILGDVKNGMIEGDGPTINGVAESKTVSGVATATFSTVECATLSGFNGDLATSSAPEGGVCDPDGSGPYNPGDVPIRVVSGNVSLDKVPLIVSGPANKNFTFISSPSDADGDDGSSPGQRYTLGVCKDKVSIIVFGRDINNNPIDGVPVIFKATKGELTADTEFKDGTATAELATATSCDTGTTDPGPGQIDITIKNAPASDIVLTWYFEVK